MIKDGKYLDNHFHDDLVKAAALHILESWHPDPMPTWVTAIPSNRHPTLVPDFATRLAEQLNLPFHTVLHRIGDTREQKTMQNSSMQAKNVIGSLEIQQKIPTGPVLLIDDIIDSGWTLTMAGFLILSNGCSCVYPYALAQATGRNP